VGTTPGIEREKDCGLQFSAHSGTLKHRLSACILNGVEGHRPVLKLNKFKAIEIVQGSDSLRDQFKRAGSCFSGLGRLRGDPANLIAGKTYTVRLEPSDETWGQIEDGNESISLSGWELEVVRSVPED